MQDENENAENCDNDNNGSGNDGIDIGTDGTWNVNPDTPIVPEAPTPAPEPIPEPKPVIVTIRDQKLELKPEEVDVELVLKLTKIEGWKKFLVSIKKAGESAFFKEGVDALKTLAEGDAVKIVAFTQHGA